MNPKLKVVIIVIVLPLVFYFSWINLAPTISNDMKYANLSEDELSSMAIPWNYSDIVRNPNDYYGEILQMNGKVEYASNERLAIKISYTCGSHPYNLICNYAVIDNTSDLRILDGDKVHVYGFLDGFTNWPDAEPSPIIRSISLKCSSC
tara:strand:- start:135 stop:581 length:447 start_codon:yes stop_codon:yes gene_type:complete